MSHELASKMSFRNLHLFKLLVCCHSSSNGQVKHHLFTSTRHCDSLDIPPDTFYSLTATASCETDTSHNLDGVSCHVLQHNSRMGLELGRGAC